MQEGSSLWLIFAVKLKKGARLRLFRTPDAGKTTLTEKFLLYGGAINLAGAVKAKRTPVTRVRLDGN